MCGPSINKNSAPLGSRVSEAARVAKDKTAVNNANIGAVAAVGAVGVAAMAAMQARAPGVGLAVGAIAGAIGGGILAAGMSIKLPGNEVYTIAHGDTLHDIAQKALGDKAT